ncbi:hypothetical protein DFA_05708 [Cavenderia fasciculata]|uniref:Uncharacterized protein n=1 Tax=Cavenderia fasciculata TaxID=261658 RepID=F4PM75_CACFS|nr:uncharacterized protein DFA_05708 [Cavenderia fasciculata]EGG23575.1 hypothetical protein DFA_05708 [Cavenderia fasciculata]|eukprot:XP_004361426.1 hypothetical protein DFA_05708 [Cavenderia fasciculata]
MSTIISIVLLVVVATSVVVATQQSPSMMNSFLMGGYFSSFDMYTGQSFGNYFINVPKGLSTNTVTTIAQFNYAFNNLLTFQYNSIDLSSGLAFSTYCGASSNLVIFDFNNETVYVYIQQQQCEGIPFKSSACSLYTIGAYDNMTQTYYLIGDLEGSVLSSLTFGVYSMITKDITYVEIPYHMDSNANLQQVFVYDSVVYACVFQSSFTEVIAIDFATRSTKSIFRVSSIMPEGQFAFDTRGYITGFIDEDTKLYNAYIINLKTLDVIHNEIPYPSDSFVGNYNSNLFCSV